MAKISEIGTLLNGLKKYKNLGAHHCWVNSNGDLAVGVYPTETSVFDFGSEAFESSELMENAVAAESKDLNAFDEVDLSDEAGRRTKTLFIRTPNRKIKVGSVKQALEVALQEIEKNWNGSLAILCDLSRERGRSKRMVAENKEQLYDTTSLVEHSSKVADGYFAATNNSEGEVQRFLKQARKALGLDNRKFAILTENGDDWFEINLYVG